jgi:predicted DNA-binding transcriptional regulator YafY
VKRFFGCGENRAILFKTGENGLSPEKKEKFRFKMAKAERLLYLINLIKSHHNLTSKALAEKCGVSERTIFRDINSLASATLPIYYDHGYKFLESAFLPTLNLTDEELSTLRFVFEFSPIKADRSLQELAKNILSKLEASKTRLPPGELVRSKQVEQDIPSSPHETSKFSLMFKLLNLAIDQQRTIRIRYRKRGNHLDEFLIEPYALVSKNGEWLVLCYCWHCRKIVFYDVSKIKSVSLTTQTFKSKINLDKLLAAHQ